MLVEAAAGTGKTTSLVARMINLIREGKCPIDKLAAVTFTRKAAAELRGSVSSWAGEGRSRGDGDRDGSGWPGRRARRALVSRNHPLLLRRLLRERPVEAGVDAEFIELDEAEDSELRQRAWSEHVARLIASDDPLLAELEDLGLEIGQLEAGVRTIRRLSRRGRMARARDRAPRPGAGARRAAGLRRAHASRSRRRSRTTRATTS